MLNYKQLEKSGYKGVSETANLPQMRFLFHQRFFGTFVKSAFVFRHRGLVQEAKRTRSCEVTEQLHNKKSGIR